MQIIPVLEEQREVNVVDDRIAELVETVRAHRDRIAGLEAKNEMIKDELRHLLEMRGENWSDDEGYARLVPDGTRTSYETKGLDDLIIRDPQQYGWLKDYRKQSMIRSSIQVR